MEPAVFLRCRPLLVELLDACFSLHTMLTTLFLFMFVNVLAPHAVIFYDDALGVLLFLEFNLLRYFCRFLIVRDIENLHWILGRYVFIVGVWALFGVLSYLVLFCLVSFSRRHFWKIASLVSNMLSVHVLEIILAFSSNHFMLVDWKLCLPILTNSSIVMTIHFCGTVFDFETSWVFL